MQNFGTKNSEKDRGFLIEEGRVLVLNGIAAPADVVVAFVDSATVRSTIDVAAASMAASPNIGGWFSVGWVYVALVTVEVLTVVQGAARSTSPWSF